MTETGEGLPKWFCRACGHRWPEDTSACLRCTSIDIVVADGTEILREVPPELRWHAPHCPGLRGYTCTFHIARCNVGLLILHSREGKPWYRADRAKRAAVTSADELRQLDQACELYARRGARWR